MYCFHSGKNTLRMSQGRKKRAKTPKDAQKRQKQKHPKDVTFDEFVSFFRFLTGTTHFLNMHFLSAKRFFRFFVPSPRMSTETTEKTIILMSLIACDS